MSFLMKLFLRWLGRMVAGTGSLREAGPLEGGIRFLCLCIFSLGGLGPVSGFCPFVMAFDLASAGLVMAAVVAFLPRCVPCKLHNGRGHTLDNT